MSKLLESMTLMELHRTPTFVKFKLRTNQAPAEYFTYSADSPFADMYDEMLAGLIEKGMCLPDVVV